MITADHPALADMCITISELRQRTGFSLYASDFRRHGFYEVDQRSGRWQDVHKWLLENFDGETYTWTGATFWFDSAEDATMFKLAWG
jgi:hypothetical protein